MKSIKDQEGLTQIELIVVIIIVVILGVVFVKSCTPAGFSLKKGEIGTPYMATFTPPAGANPTVTSISGLPPSISRTGFNISGTPNGDEFGTWPIVVTGTVGGSTFTIQANLIIDPPSATFAPPSGFTMTFSAMLSNKVTVTVSPAATYTVSVPQSIQCGPQQIIFSDPNGALPTNTDNAGILDLFAAAQTEGICGRSVNVRITSKAPNNPTIDVVIPVSKNIRQ